MPFDHEKSRFWKRLLPTNASWWELAAAAITVVFAFRHTAISLFFARFNVSPEEIGMGLTTVAVPGPTAGSRRESSGFAPPLRTARGSP